MSLFARGSGFSVLAMAVSLVSVSQAQAVPAAVARHAEDLGQPVSRVLGPVDDTVRTAIPNSVHAAVERSTDLGRVAGTTATGPMRLMLKATPEQELSQVADAGSVRRTLRGFRRRSRETHRVAES